MYPIVGALTLRASPSPSTFLQLSLKPKYPNLSLSSKTLKITATSSSSSSPNPIFKTLKTATAATILLAATFSVSKFPAKAEPAVPTIATSSPSDAASASSPLTLFLESNSEAVNALKSLLQQKLESHEDEEALKILKNLILAQPEETQWKFLKARVLSEMGKNSEARKVFDEILEKDPLSYEALFENALLMDKCGEENAVMGMLEKALDIAVEEKKAKEARDVRLIMAQVEFLHKNVDGALGRYDELAKEDPSDFRPYFCKGMIFSLLDRNKEAREEFAKYRERSPKKFEVEGYLRTPLSKTKLFGTDEGN